MDSNNPMKIKRKKLKKSIVTELTANVVSLDEYRKQNIAKIRQGESIESQMAREGKWEMAAGFFVPRGGGDAVFMATSRLNPMEAAGLSLSIAIQCSQRSDFKDVAVPHGKKKKTSDSE